MSKTITIIGIGSLGQTLARALYGQGYHIKGIYNRTSDKAERLGSELGAASGTFPSSADELGEILFLTVSDGVIAETAERIAGMSGDFSGKMVAHCSGAETSALLDPLQKVGVQIAAFHPLQTFNFDSDPQVFHDIYISLEGQEAAVDQLEQIVADLGAHPLRLSPKAKSYLHASAVMVSNYLFALVQMAGDIAELGEIDHHEARKALLPLVKTTAQSSSEADLADVLSGPIARGDAATIKKHVELLEQNEQLSSLYRQLGLVTLKLANKDGKFNKEKLRQLQLLLSKNISGDGKD